MAAVPAHRPGVALHGDLAAAVGALADEIGTGGAVHAFGTGHSEAFAMEIAGRAGGLGQDGTAGKGRGVGRAS